MKYFGPKPAAFLSEGFPARLIIHSNLVFDAWVERNFLARREGLGFLFYPQVLERCI